MVLGRYGDIVQFPDAPTYLSWYPTCLRGWSTTLEPPTEWNGTCAGIPPPEIADAVERETLQALERIIPGLGASEVQTVDGGVIFSWGETDIDDPKEHAPPASRNRLDPPRWLLFGGHGKIYLRAPVRATVGGPSRASMNAALPPLISVALPLYRSRRFLDIIVENLDTIAYPHLEILVSDRHCADDTIDVLEQRYCSDAAFSLFARPR